MMKRLIFVGVLLLTLPLFAQEKIVPPVSVDSEATKFLFSVSECKAHAKRLADLEARVARLEKAMGSGRWGN